MLHVHINSLRSYTSLSTDHLQALSYYYTRFDDQKSKSAWASRASHSSSSACSCSNGAAQAMTRGCAMTLLRLKLRISRVSRLTAREIATYV